MRLDQRVIPPRAMAAAAGSQGGQGSEPAAVWHRRSASRLRMGASTTVLLLAAACAPHMTPPPTQVANAGAPPDHHILLFEDSVLPADLDARVRQAGGALTGSLPEIGVVFASSSDPRFMDRASLIDGVQGVSPDVGEGLTPSARNEEAQPRESVDAADDDELYHLQWGHQAMDVPRAWALGARGAGVRVAVIDNGIDATHPDLAGRINHHLSRSFAPAVAWDDPIDSHGTSVASVLVAEDNGRGMIGVAPEAELVVIRVHPGGPPRKALFSWMLESLAYAVEIDADVVNVSITAPLPTDGGCVGRQQRPRADEARVCFTAEEVATLLESFNCISRHAWMNDTLIFAASGNYAMTVTKDDGTTLLPAEAEYVFSIAATGPHGRADDPDVSLDDVPAYSNVGDGFVAFAAPGGRFRIDPDAAEDCTSRPAIPHTCLDNVVTAKAGGGYWLRGGTSYASPHAAGVAALIFSVLPHKSAPVVLGLMRLGAEDLGPPGRDARYGFGRLNAGNSVQRAIAVSSAAR